MRRITTTLTTLTFLISMIFLSLSTGCEVDDHGRGPDFDHGGDHGHVDIDHRGDVHEDDHH